MKQKVTIKVSMECETCRNKALKIASMITGVSSVAIEGDSKDKVVVTGEDVDTVCLGRILEKKFRSVTVPFRLFPFTVAILITHFYFLQ